MSETWEEVMLRSTQGVTTSASVNVGVHLPPPVVALLDECARQWGTTRAGVLREACRCLLNSGQVPDSVREQAPTDKDGYVGYTGSRLRRDPIRSWQESR